MKYTIKHGLITCLALALVAMLLPWVIFDLNAVIGAAGVSIPGLGAVGAFSGSAAVLNTNGFSIWSLLQYMLSIFSDTVQMGNAIVKQPTWIWVRYFLAIAIPAGGYTLTVVCFFMAIFSKSKKAALSIAVMQAVTAIIALVEVIVIYRFINFAVGAVALARMGAGSVVYLVAGIASVIVAVLLMKNRADTETFRPKPSNHGIMCLAGEYQGVSVPMEDGAAITIGRDASCCNLVISGSKISRKHCQITYEKARNKYMVTDFSTNGTYIKDGTRLVKERSMELDPGTVLTLGNDANSFRLQ